MQYVDVPTLCFGYQLRILLIINHISKNKTIGCTTLVCHLFNKLNPMHYHVALVPLIQSTGEPEITEVTLDTFSYAAVYWLQNKSYVWRQKRS